MSDFIRITHDDAGWGSVLAHLEAGQLVIEAAAAVLGASSVRWWVWPTTG